MQTHAFVKSLLIGLVAMLAVHPVGSLAQTVKEISAPELHARLFNAHLKGLSESCDQKMRPTECLDRFWRIGDVSGDGKLSPAEIVRILRMTAGYVAYQDYVKEFGAYTPSTDTIPPKNEEAIWVTGTATIGPVFSQIVIANFDYDNDGLISKPEILYDLAEDRLLSSVETLPDEIRGNATKALQLLLPLITK